MFVILSLVGLLALAFAAFQHVKAKRILAAPFRGTGALAADPTSPDPKGLMSTEGEIVTQAPLLSPCSRTRCLYYEVEIIRHGEKEEMTQDGSKKDKKHEVVQTLKEGVVFQLDDGSGPLRVDAREGGDFDDMKPGFKETVKLGFTLPGELQFGELRIRTPKLPKGETTKSFEAVEKFVPAEGNLFALGRIDAGVLGKPGWRSMMFSAKGRAGLLGATQKGRKLALIGAAACFVLAVPFAFLGGDDSHSTAAGTACSSSMTDAVATCHDNVSTRSGRSYQWTVATPGHYEVTVVPAPGKKFPLEPSVVLSSGDSAVAQMTGNVGEPTTLSQHLEPGSYHVVVRDGSGITVKGGFDYTLETRAVAAQVAPSLAPSALNAAKDGRPVAEATPPAADAAVVPARHGKHTRRHH